MDAICSDFKWSGFRILDSIQNPEHLKTNLFLSIRYQDWSGCQILNVLQWGSELRISE